MIRWATAAATLVLASFGTLAGAEQTRTYVVGVVPQFDVRTIHANWRPLLNYLERETGERFELRGSTSIPAFELEFSEGSFDFAYMNPYHLIKANEAAGYLPLVRDHGRRLHGVLVVRKDSGIGSPAQLAGKTIAFPAPNALGASLQMRQELHDDFAIDFTPSYVKTHDSVYLNVLLGEVAAGGGVQGTLDQQTPSIRDALTVIHRTHEVAPHPLCALPDVPQSVRDKVTAAMIRLGETEQGRALLAGIPIRQVGEASLDDYLPLKALKLDRYFVDH
ncbi:MAG: phosphate/phosphite/phosphonate ABC transporter substrate-binding protein [Gammaproteobacteria bacterium]|nr:phosphate/phosphite/phosphonate ABC transporter substrate-binding protein [Gammaproteobacteria bacterium]